MKGQSIEFKKSQGYIVIFMLTFLCLFAVASNSAFAADYPNRSINFLIPYGPGGITDIVGRALVTAANKHIKEPIVAINRPGGSGSVAAMAVATSNPDGYTIGLCTASQMLVAPHDPETPFHNLEGFTFIMNYGGNLHGYIIRSDASWKTWGEFINAARSQPGKIKVGVTGAPYNNYSGLLMSHVAEREKIKFALIPFKSGAEIISALIGGHIDLYATAIDPPTMSFIKQGKARPLAMADIKLADYDNIPLLVELYDFPRDVQVHVAGVFGPKGLPEPIAAKLEEVFTKASKDEEFKNVMTKLLVPERYVSRKEMRPFIDKAFIATGVAIKKVLEEMAKEKK
jgi:tripartite-type tricarboxylate transporter receptor subunit TctC